MVLPIYVYGSTVLRKVSTNITPDYEGLSIFLEDLWETMYYADGVGLAAPQVGRNIRVFVIDATAAADEDPVLQNFKKCFINAEIYERFGDEDLFNEGCLSLPNIREDVSRPTIIKIRYLDENFQPHDEEYSGFAARVIQHEYDHLEGKMFIDHLSPLRKTLMKSKLLSMSKGNFKADYRCKIVK